MSKKLFLLCTLVWSAFFGPALFTYADWKPYAWLVTVQTEYLGKQIMYEGSKLEPFVRTNISYAAANGTSNVSYENMWFCKGKPYGLERYNSLALTPGEIVAIQIVHQSNEPSLDEIKAGVNAALRVLVDARANNSVVTLMIVPTSSYSTVLAEMQGENFVVDTHPPEVPYRASLPILLIDQLDKQKQNLYFPPSS